MFSTRTNKYLYKSPAQYMHDSIQQARTGLPIEEQTQESLVDLANNDRTRSSDDQADDEASATETMSPPLYPHLTF